LIWYCQAYSNWFRYRFCCKLFCIPLSNGLLRKWQNQQFLEIYVTISNINRSLFQLHALVVNLLTFKSLPLFWCIMVCKYNNPTINRLLVYLRILSLAKLSSLFLAQYPWWSSVFLNIFNRWCCKLQLCTILNEGLNHFEPGPML